MGKRSYRSVDVKSVNVTRLLADIGPDSISVGLDVGKQHVFAALMRADGEVKCTVRWRRSAELPDFVALLKKLPGAGLRVALESTSRYGDIIITHVREAGIAVHQASTKRVHDAAEEYDGVPSKHDGKDAAVVADLLRRNKTNPVRERSAAERALGAGVHFLLVLKARYGGSLNRLEAELGRFWPELTEHLALETVSLASLLAEFGVPTAVAAAPRAAQQLLRQAGGCLLAQSKIDAVVASAATTRGEAALPEEARLVQLLAQDALRTLRDVQAAEKELHKTARTDASVVRQAEVIGLTTAAVVVGKAGDAAQFASPGAYLKNLGLNLRENSSGMGGQRGVSITKRGDSRVRQYLFLASLRLVQTDAVVRAWYVHQTQRPGSVKMKVIVALMRKLAKALWHVAKGARFDATKLFDTSRFMSTGARHAAA
jgi:transposase